MTITSTPRWSLGRGNAVVPSRWQATLVVRGATVGQINDTRHYPVVEYQLGPSARRTRPDRKPQAGHWGGNPTPGGRVAALASEGNVIDRR
jgi:hypothetical protein